MGDTLSAEKELRDWVNEGDDTKISFKVIGIIENGASILGSKLDERNSKEDYRTLFWNYYDYYNDGLYLSGYSPICCGVSISMPVRGRRRC